MITARVKRNKGEIRAKVKREKLNPEQSEVLREVLTKLILQKMPTVKACKEHLEAIEKEMERRGLVVNESELKNEP